MASITVTTGQELRDTREAAGLTQTDVARAMGTDRGYVSVIEAKSVVGRQAAERYRTAVRVLSLTRPPKELSA